MGGMRMGAPAILSAPGAKSEVANTEKGVDVTLTAEKPEDVARVQEAVQAAVMQIQQMAENARARMAQQPLRPAAARQFLPLLLSGDLVLSTRKTEKGMVVSLTSEKPEVVQTIQQNAPQWVTQERDRLQAMEAERTRLEALRAAAGVVSQQDVKLDVKQTDKGVAIEITSTNPDAVKQIQEKLPAALKDLKEMAADALQARPAGRGMGGMGGPMMRRGGPGGPPGGPPPAGPQGPPPPAPPQ